MKKLLAVSMLLLFSGSAYSTDSKVDLSEAGWICYAQGKVNMGGPVGDIWQTVSGKGPTEFEAMHNAEQNCSSQGLQMCQVRHCSEL